MKKYLVLSVLLVCCFASRAYDFSAVAPTGQTLYYNITSSSTLTVAVSCPNIIWSGYTMPTGALTIPSTVSYSGNTYSVTTIGDYAFDGCSGLTSVTIPNTVTFIEDYAFALCSGLTSVTIGNSVTSIGKHAFDDCIELTSVTIPNSVTSIGDYAFYFCSGLTSVIIPNSVTSIGNYAFYHCNGLTSVIIGNSVASIGKSAFGSCSAITNIITQNSTAPILGDDCFEGVPKTTSVHIPCGSLESYLSRWSCFSNLSESATTLQKK